MCIRDRNIPGVSKISTPFWILEELFREFLQNCFHLEKSLSWFVCQKSYFFPGRKGGLLELFETTSIFIVCYLFQLCLMSGEIIQLSEVMSMIFECNDLSQASPATVSRCGMIYLEPSSLGWRPVLRSWINTLPENLRAEEKLITALFEWVCPPLLYFVRKNCKVCITHIWCFGSAPATKFEYKQRRTEQFRR